MNKNYSNEILKVIKNTKVGIFWIINNRIFDYSCKTYDLVKNENDDVAFYGIHINAWSNINKKLESSLKRQEYTAYPRGRVSYYIDENIFKIKIGKEFLNRLDSKYHFKDIDLYNDILNTFGLDSKKCEVLPDEHYADDPYIRALDDSIG